MTKKRKTIDVYPAGAAGDSMNDALEECAALLAESRKALETPVDAVPVALEIPVYPDCLAMPVETPASSFHVATASDKVDAIPDAYLQSVARKIYNADRKSYECALEMCVNVAILANDYNRSASRFIENTGYENYFALCKGIFGYENTRVSQFAAIGDKYVDYGAHCTCKIGEFGLSQLCLMAYADADLIKEYADNGVIYPAMTVKELGEKLKELSAENPLLFPKSSKGRKRKEISDGGTDSDGETDSDAARPSAKNMIVSGMDADGKTLEFNIPWKVLKKYLISDLEESENDAAS